MSECIDKCQQRGSSLSVQDITVKWNFGGNTFTDAIFFLFIFFSFFLISVSVENCIWEKGQSSEV